MSESVISEALAKIETNLDATAGVTIQAKTKHGVFQVATVHQHSPLVSENTVNQKARRAAKLIATDKKQQKAYHRYNRR